MDAPASHPTSLLPELDVAELARFALMTDQHDALVAYRAALRG